MSDSILTPNVSLRSARSHSPPPHTAGICSPRPFSPPRPCPQPSRSRSPCPPPNPTQRCSTVLLFRPSNPGRFIELGSVGGPTDEATVTVLCWNAAGTELAAGTSDGREERDGGARRVGREREGWEKRRERETREREEERELRREKKRKSDGFPSLAPVPAHPGRSAFAPTVNRGVTAHGHRARHTVTAHGHGTCSQHTATVHGHSTRPPHVPSP